MSCGCNKRNTECTGSNCKSKMTNVPPDNSSSKSPPISSHNTQKPPEIKFTERKVEPPSIMKKIGMVQSFAAAIASRGTTNNKVNIPLKQLRILSCFGNKETGGELPPCEYLRKSETEGKFFCGGCGCGDKPLTWLMAGGDEYSKLDYPKLNCPLQMPGFTNYKESTPEEAISPITRRHYIENVNYDVLKNIQVSVHDTPTEEQD